MPTEVGNGWRDCNPLKLRQYPCAALAKQAAGPNSPVEPRSGGGHISIVGRLKAPRTQLTLNLGALIASAGLWVVAAVTGWLELVEFVAHVSMLALVLASLSGVASALVGMEQVSGFTLNQADKVWLEQMVERKIADGRHIQSPHR